MIKCKHCRNENCLEPIVGFLYEDLMEDKFYHIDGFKCSLCGCIYSFKEDNLQFWEFEASYNNKVEINNVVDWKI